MTSASAAVAGTSALEPTERDVKWFIAGALAVQVLGIITGFVGERALGIDNVWYLHPLLPLVIAAGMLLPMMFYAIFAARMKTALAMIYILFITVDTFCLAALVYFTGGPHHSIFLPVFVLIPAITTCYCRPGWRFWFNIILVGICLLVVSQLQQLEVDPENTGATTEYLTIMCIVTAALCYYVTEKVRKNACERQNGLSNCRSFYL
ncbi:hypothetical protein LCGC14_1392360 [marine sediment metagenome]|uniref:Uncharacterized protein n=1 Tax=marine sediment metagenome TaxID=412755 RepID=A0A0F9N163_9ZZZZ